MRNWWDSLSRKRGTYPKFQFFQVPLFFHSEIS
jgi:hypothetical protein